MSVRKPSPDTGCGPQLPAPTYKSPIAAQMAEGPLLPTHHPEPGPKQGRGCSKVPEDRPWGGVPEPCPHRWGLGSPSGHPHGSCP